MTNFRGLGHPRGLERTRKTLQKRWNLAKILRTGFRHVYVNIYICIYIHIYIYCIDWFLGFPGGSDGKESTCNVADLGSIPGLGRSPGEGNSYPLQYSGLENSMDRGVQQAISPRSGKESDITERLSLHINWLLSGNNKLILSGNVYKEFIYQDKEK